VNASNAPTFDEPTFDDVTAAARAINGHVVRTVTATSTVLSQLTGAEAVLKYETHQFTGSYKERGALNRLLALTVEQCARGVVAVSAGNHAQGVAYHATRLGIASTIVMPVGTPFVKVARTRALGATVELHGRTFDEAASRGRELADAGAILVHPFDDPLIVAGQGTVGLELLTDRPDVEVLLVPIGGGGLASGVALARDALAPDCEVVGVQSERFPGLVRALANDTTPVPGGATLAEGIAVARPGDLTTAMLRDRLSDVIVVSEGAIEHAVYSLLEVERIVVEGAGAAGLAALEENRGRFAGRRVGIVLTGSNIDQRVLSEVVERGLVREGRVSTLRLLLDDTPGQLAEILATVAGTRANLLEVQHERRSADTPVREVVVTITIETLDNDHLAEVRAALERSGAQLM
jgi:threonine dehydratase